MDPKEVVDAQARQDIAVIKSGLERIDRTLNQIFTAILVAMAGAAGAQVWGALTHTFGK
jgi:hypothetical protein